MTTRRRFLQFSGAALATPALPRFASAQQKWPVRPIRAIVPFSAGSTIDVIGRIVLEPLSAALGQPIVVDNRGGAGGSIGTALVAKAEPDGHTLLIHASAHSAAPAVYPNLAYDPAHDLSGVVIFGTVPNVTVISPAKGIKTLKELVEAAKKGSFTFASAGVGSATHWAAERLRLAAGFNAVHVPFRGGPEALTDVATGRVDFMSIGISSGLPFIRSGRLIPLAVSTLKRSSALPDVPTTIEAGYPGSDYTFWNGMLVPAKTPRAIVQRLHAEMQKVLRQPSVVEKLKVQGVDALPLTPAEFDAMVAKEVKNNIALVKALGLKFN
ncbi:MAG: tripartite tricarboxylate transporter substrate binding protein [Betaproteobacteria bacterium]|nr:tripartite tricarboxylate transporter substrate binding protein [Betaproteobacteria bacterium]